MSATTATVRAAPSGIFRATLHDGLAAARAGDRRATLIIAAQQIFLGLVPMIVLVVLVKAVLSSHTEAVDFRNAYYVAGYRLLHGGDPYAWTRAQLSNGVAFVYPALSALVFAPFALLSRTAASFTFTFICIGLVPLTLWVLKVRDWRIYTLTMVWLPVFGAWQTANETMLLTAMTALVWRYRDRPAVGGILTAVAVSMKTFIWPLGLWLLATRRWRASGWAVLSGLVLNVVSWAVVGTSNISVFLHDSSIDAKLAWRAGYSLVAIAGHVGLGRTAGEALMVVISVALVVAVVWLAFVKRREQQALTVAILLMLAASPLVWSHYFALLLIPLALQRPRLNWLWFLPVLMWVCPPSFHVHAWQELIAWMVGGGMFAALLFRKAAP